MRGIGDEASDLPLRFFARGERLLKLGEHGVQGLGE